MNTSENSDQLIARFATRFPHLKSAIQTSVHAYATEERDALFFVPASTLGREGRDFIEVHVHDLKTGKMVDVGSTTSYGDVEKSLLNMIHNYQADACHMCIESRALCHEHLPPGGQKFLWQMCESCGYSGDEDEGREPSEEQHTYLKPCNEGSERCCDGAIYTCNDCGYELHV